MEGLLNGRGDLDGNIRMLKRTGAKFIGRSLCLWTGEANLIRNLERAKEQITKVLAADADMILQACVFESVWVWGYDEITWFAHQSRTYRAGWLRYARDWVRTTDPSGFLQMPGSRTMRSPRDGKRWYYANEPSPSVPEGLGDEEAIHSLWADDSVGE
jgi:hypothetical protein